MSDQPIDSEYLCQCDGEDVFKIAQTLVNLAFAVLVRSKDQQEMALEAIGLYGDIHKLTDLPPLIQAKLLISNYGVEEFEAMGEIGEVPHLVWIAYLESRPS